MRRGKRWRSGSEKVGEERVKCRRVGGEELGRGPLPKLPDLLCGRYSGSDEMGAIQDAFSLKAGPIFCCLREEFSVSVRSKRMLFGREKRVNGESFFIVNCPE